MGEQVTVYKEISAENVFSDPLTIKKGDFQFFLRGTWTATVVVQMKPYPGEDDFFTVDRLFTANGIWIAENGLDDCQVRFGVQTGDFGAGTVQGRLNQTVE